MKCDPEKYLSLADTLEISREQKIEVIRIVWGIMEACIDKAFGIHPVQNACGIEGEMPLKISPCTVDSKDKSSNSTLFNHCTIDATYSSEERHDQ